MMSKLHAQDVRITHLPPRQPLSHTFGDVLRISRQHELLLDTLVWTALLGREPLVVIHHLCEACNGAFELSSLARLGFDVAHWHRGLLGLFRSERDAPASRSPILTIVQACTVRKDDGCTMTGISVLILVFAIGAFVEEETTIRARTILHFEVTHADHGIWAVEAVVYAITLAA